jgi:mono/diheme cytochrome c family protein
MSTQNPDVQSPAPPNKNATVQPDAPDFVETQDVAVTPSLDHEPLPVWLYLVCGFALFMAGSSFTGFGEVGTYDQGPGAPIVASGAGNAAAAAPLDPMAIGKQVYGGNCANCHQASGEGQPGSYPPLAGSEWVLGDKSALYAIMLHGLQGPLTVKGGEFGSQQMPGWSTTLNDEKIADVMTYIRASWGNTADAVTPAEVTAARAKYAAKADAYTEPELMKMAPKK